MPAIARKNNSTGKLNFMMLFQAFPGRISDNFNDLRMLKWIKISDTVFSYDRKKEFQ